ncbi:MAG: bifunctional phosphoribosylaminoimidazolecarboxamide formyltransferase/IMP cyclohydrolase [Deltaproteobacteria bacterium]|jgi:phosphoribosylaminoimidazolecarboxamide formyltransferase / IMP cyclohydrolase|nr:bifunctional phosphoribosylaminoimidazolecarboxamide formyltransferase/IMP cyclohydrolase [Deltaproteobacteria bacterium]
MKIKRALVSVFDKTGIIDFVRELHKNEIEIISTGGTAKAIRDAGIPVKDVSDVTGFPETMNGRVKTLHPLIHGGILACRDNDSHMQSVTDLKIPLIDMIVVNLYPFLEVIKDENVALDVAIENIDIGGPTMLRAAAKNYKYVTVVTDPADYSRILNQVKSNGTVDEDIRAELAIKVFNTTSRYDAAIDTYLSQKILSESKVHLHYSNGQELRYGENSHQQAKFYKDLTSTETSTADAEVLNGKAMSYNNYVDANAAFEVVKDLPEDKPAVSVIKHMNPCGLATGNTVAEAIARAWEGDVISSFGGVIATNSQVDLEFAEFLKGESVKHLSYSVVKGEYIPAEVPTGKFVEVVIAPGYDDDAFEFLKAKSKTIRLLKTKPTLEKEKTTFRSITGGLLVQTRDDQLIDRFEVVTEKQFSDNYRALAEFTIVACKNTKSNAIVLGREYAPNQFQVIGMGAGQPNRVDSMRKLSITKARENMKREFETQNIQGDFEPWWLEQVGKMVLASDAFFPFDDTVREAASFGIKHIVQPGGSMRDDDAIKACNELGMAMAFTGLRHFNH